jgi:hypothetical protein
VNPISFSNTASLFGRRVYPHSHDCILFCSLHKLMLRC